MRNIFYLFFLSSILFSCEKEDKAIVLPPPGALTKATADIGPNYDEQVYVNLATGNKLTGVEINMIACC